MLDVNQQILERLKGAKRVLITCKQDMHVDSLAACLAMYLVLQKLGVPAEIVVGGPHPTVDRCKFLPKSSEIVCDGRSLKNLVIHISPKGGKLRDFRYEVENGTLKIFVAPSAGEVVPGDVRSEVVHPNHDLIVVLDTQDLNSLGQVYTDHADFFYKTPIINIDHNPANEQFGEINLVDIKAVSTTELIFRLLETLGDDHLDADVATALLAGMIAKTESFKSGSVTPRALMIASELVQRGARRDEIVQNLYRTHDIKTLRLWGRVLARLQHDEKRRIVWSLVTRDDFEKSGTAEEQLPGIIDELITTTPDARTVGLLYERSDGAIGGWLKTDPNYSAVELTKEWGGVGSKVLARFTIPGASIKDAEKELNKIFSGLPV
ncbi:MAG: DHH family phosphoesterase [Patescibacteria group bacterium]